MHLFGGDPDCICTTRGPVPRRGTIAARRLALATLAVFFVGAVANVASAGPITAGDDIWSTPCGGGAYDYTPIPAGFFESVSGETSKAYLDGIELGGVPLDISPALSPAADVDTVVRRLTGTTAGFDVGSPAEIVGLEIQALQLRSCGPITVEYQDGSTEQWDVDVCLLPTQTTGTMELSHECTEGGSYVASLPVDVVLTFSRVGGGPGSPLDLSPVTLTLESEGWWVHSDPGLSLSRLSPGTQFDDDCDGVADAGDPTTINSAVADFYAGLFLQGCGGPTPPAPAGGTGCCNTADPFCEDPNCADCVCSFAGAPCCGGAWDPAICVPFANNECADVCPCGGGGGPIIIKPAINPEQAQLAAHGVAIANPGKTSGGGNPVPAAACCKPGAMPGTRCIDVDPTECVDLWNGTPHVGENCATVQCANDPVDNWIIADDFNIKCDKCQCDINGDGACDQADVNFLDTCIPDPTAAGCGAADVDCDGDLDADDRTILNCLVSGGTEDQCCPAAVIDRVRWYGSYFDPDFEPGAGGTPPVREVDSWLLGLHTDVPPVACPPVPLGTKPFDFCGRLDACSVAGGFVFTPQGSGFSYNLFDSAGLLGSYSAGDTVRICGYQDPNAPAVCTSGINNVNVQAVAPCRSKVSRPGRLIAQWVVDPSDVLREPTGKTGCDTHRIFCYTADLPNACLVHDDSAPGEIDPATGQFNPQPGKTYWLSVQAAVGHAVDPADCSEIDTGNTATNEFWGWHTTPPGYQHLDDAYMGNLAMTCQGEWIYDWTRHLHCSQSQFTNCCDDPTKSIDMAFYLIDRSRVCENDPSISCVTDAECSAVGGACVDAEDVHWCQPVNPGPLPATPVPVPTFPPGGIDEFPLTTALVTVTIPSVQPDPMDLTLTGPTVVWRGIEHEDIGAASTRIDTEMLSMNLTGFHPVLGDVELRLSNIGSSGKDGVRSTGGALGPPPTGTFQVDSFFDVWTEVSINGATGGSTVAVVESPVHLTATLHEIPPADATYRSDPQPVNLIDRDTGQIIGTLDQVLHIIPPAKGGVNVHSDVDWGGTPTVDCCEPNADATGCEQTVCPDSTQECIPTAYSCTTTVGACADTGDPCTSDAECTAGVTCVGGSVDCIVADCDCRNPEECHAEKTPPNSFIPIYCTGPCPPGLVCTRIELDLSNPPDGIIDWYECRCEEDQTEVCPLPPPVAGVVDPCAALQSSDCIADAVTDETCEPRFVQLGPNGFVATQCECFPPDGDCGPIEVTNDTITCTGTCELDDGTIGDCVIFAAGTSLGASTLTLGDPQIPPGVDLYCDCEPTPPAGACCYDADGDGIDEACSIVSPTECATLGGTFLGEGTFCGDFGACCLDADNDGVSESCREMYENCCEDSGGTFRGVGSVCEGDANGNGVDDACDCDVLPGELVQFHSGNGPVGGFDTAIRVMYGPGGLPLRSFAFTASDFAKACSSPQAQVITPHPAWLPGSGGILPANPTAQWIAALPSLPGGGALPHSALYCQQFRVCCPNVLSADLTISFAVDDQLGDAPFGPNNIGVYVNNTPVPGLSGVGFGSQITLTAPVGGLLLPGVNTLHVYQRDTFNVISGVIYDVNLDVNCEAEACCFPDGRCEDLDPCCCVDLGGTPQGTGSDCTTTDCAPPQLYCTLPAPPGTVDPCDALQATDCQSDDPTLECLPFCTQVKPDAAGIIRPVATKCSCYAGSECGPVEIVDDGITTRFVCNPTDCPAPLVCQIHINGSPTGVQSIDVNAVGPNDEVKCHCSDSPPGDPCPTELPPADDPCGPLQSADCIDGATGETCNPVCVTVGTGPIGPEPVVTKCDCTDDVSCGPVKSQLLPGGLIGFRCDPVDCPAGLTCEIHINGSPTGSPSIEVDAATFDDEVKCKCADTPPGDPCPTEDPPSLDPCGMLQATDCVGGVAGETCVPTIVNVSGGVPAAATCDCLSGTECGPVKIRETLTQPPELELVCDPKDCAVAGEFCQIHYDGVAQGVDSVLAAAVPTTVQDVTCACAGQPQDVCPLSSLDIQDICLPLQDTQCLATGQNEFCRPQSVFFGAAGTPQAEACRCYTEDGLCGPVLVTPIAGQSDYDISCEAQCPSPPGGTCLIFVDGVSINRANAVSSDPDVAGGSIIDCRCADTAIAQPLPAGVPHNRTKNRYISFDPNPANAGAGPMAFEVLYDDGTRADVHVGWVGPPGRGWSGSSSCPNCAWVVDLAKRGELSGDDWLAAAASGLGNSIHVGDCEIGPDRMYKVRAVDVASGTQSSALPIPTTPAPEPGVIFWADAVGGFGWFCSDTYGCCDPNPDCPGATCPAGESCIQQWPPPDGATSFVDVSAAIRAFQQIGNYPETEWVDMHGAEATSDPARLQPPNHIPNFADVQPIIKAFQGFEYLGDSDETTTGEGPPLPSECPDVPLP